MKAVVTLVEMRNASPYIMLSRTSPIFLERLFENEVPEIFDGLKDKDIRPDLYQEAKELFERADYVKFAKYVATQGETASAVPSAVKFVTMTYQEELDTESGEAASAGDGGQRRPESGQQGKEE